MYAYFLYKHYLEFFNFKLAVRGLGDLACCNDSILNKYSSDAIQAAMAGLDDSGDRRDEVGHCFYLLLIGLTFLGVKN